MMPQKKQAHSKINIPSNWLFLPLPKILLYYCLLLLLCCYLLPQLAQHSLTPPLSPILLHLCHQHSLTPMLITKLWDLLQCCKSWGESELISTRSTSLLLKQSRHFPLLCFLWQWRHHCIFLLLIQWYMFLFPFLQSPDGDLIDCVLSHQQPAFDHPQLKGQRPLVINFIQLIYQGKWMAFLWITQIYPHSSELWNSKVATTNLLV